MDTSKGPTGISEAHHLPVEEQVAIDGCAFKFDLTVSNERLEDIFEGLREAGHEDDPSYFYGEVFWRAVYNEFDDDIILGGKVNRSVDYLGPRSIALSAAEFKDDGDLDPREVELCDAAIEAYESGDTDYEVFEDWREAFFDDATSAVVSVNDEDEILRAEQWLYDFVGTNPDAIQQSGGDGETIANPDTVVKWIVMVWSALFYLASEDKQEDTEPVLDTVSNENFLRALDSFLSIETFPFVSIPDSDPLWLLEAGYPAYDFDPETGTGRVLRAEDYEKLGEDGVSLPDDWTLKMLRQS